MDFHMPFLFQAIYCVFMVSAVTLGILIGCFIFFNLCGFILIDLQNYIEKRKAR
jgi:hypothetical protein